VVLSHGFADPATIYGGGSETVSSGGTDLAMAARSAGLGRRFRFQHQLDDVQMEEAYLGTLRAMELYTGKRDRATGALRLFLG
jgi:hypothetical protein